MHQNSLNRIINERNVLSKNLIFLYKLYQMCFIKIWFRLKFTSITNQTRGKINSINAT